MRFKAKKSEMVEVQIDALEFLTELKTRVDASSGLAFEGHKLFGTRIWCKPNGETVRPATVDELAYSGAWDIIFEETRKAKEKKLV